MFYIKFIIGVIYFGNIVAWNPLIKSLKIPSILSSHQYTDGKFINKSNNTFYFDRNDMDFIFLNNI
tara:strand:+ start:378 stop:575 length:198 start_codon:yes stop_codon:yes gene_type:complete